MNIDSSDGNGRLTATEIDSEESAAAELSPSDVHQTPTLVPPPADEAPPTVRWTPPPTLIAFSRFDAGPVNTRRNRVDARAGVSSRR
jgi:hypothetical protein